MEVQFQRDGSGTSGDLLVVAVLAGRRLTSTGGALDAACAGGLTRQVNAGRFSGEAGQTLPVAAPEGLDAGSLVLLGLGVPGELDHHGWE